MTSKSSNIEHDIATLLTSDKAQLWLNPFLNKMNEDKPLLTMEDIVDAENRLLKFAPLLEKLFPELERSHGIIESNLIETPKMLLELKKQSIENIKGKLWVKADHSLPVAGSVKARGGIYEVLCFAEELVIKHKLLNINDDYTAFTKAEIRELFSQYTISVSSTGNLGLSIGIMSAALGFKACVHMSVEAKEWKKERLRNKGVQVIEHKDDYSNAVDAGRIAAEQNPYAYFVDDENSKRLFLGYSVAALRLQKQLQLDNVIVDAEHPLFVYIPCGVGGAPGGVTFGLKQVFGKHVHCFFSEPTQAPCMLLGMATNFKNDLSVYDVGLNVDTEADGLAVSKASKLVGQIMAPILSGIFTIEDKRLFKFLYQFGVSESIKVEPSAAAAFSGPEMLFNTVQGKSYVKNNGLSSSMKNANHIVWTTGGLFVPEKEYEKFYQQGIPTCNIN